MKGARHPLANSSLALLSHEMVLSYYPANGLTDQLRQLSLALALAQLFGRRLVLPPVLRHQDATVLTAMRELPRLQRTLPSLSSLIETSTTVPPIEASSLVPVHQMPRCDPQAVHASGVASVRRRPRQVCVHVVEPPEFHMSLGVRLRAWARLSHVAWLHFDSVLDVQSARRARPKRFPLALWEQSMQPAPCAIAYRPDVLAAARRLLLAVLPPADQYYAAAHVRAGWRARSKAECTEEWLTRLRNSVTADSALHGSNGTAQAHSSRPLLVFLAADDLRFVAPRATAALAPLGAKVVSRFDLNLSLAALRSVHRVREVAEIAVDMAALLDASAFWAAPRSGFSVHVAALRGCRQGNPCDPARAACATFTSSGCGGRFPPELLTPRTEGTALQQPTAVQVPGQGHIQRGVVYRNRPGRPVSSRRPRSHLRPQPTPFDPEEQQERAAQVEMARSGKHVKHASYEYSCSLSSRPPQPRECTNRSQAAHGDAD